MMLLMIVAALAVAGPPTELSVREARVHFERANELYEEGEFAAASEELRLAYEIEPLPKLLYSRAQVERRQENWGAAADLYQKFLDTDPPEAGTVHTRRHLLFCRMHAARVAGDCETAVVLAERYQLEYAATEEVEGAAETIAACEEAPDPVDPDEPVGNRGGDLEPDRGAPPPAPTVDIDPADHPPWYRNVAGGVLLGVGGAALVTGAALIGAGYREHRFARDEPTHDGHVIRSDRARSLEVGGIVTMVASGAILVMAATAYGLAARRRGRHDIAWRPDGLRIQF